MFSYNVSDAFLLVLIEKEKEYHWMQLWVQSLFTVILHLFSMVTQHETLNPSFVMGEECSVHLCPVHLGGGEEHLTLSIVTFC